MEKHFVTFYSPGTMFAETSTREVEAWDPAVAKEMASEIVERHGAKPYGFRFSTRSRGPNDLDSKETAKSGFYYLKGRILTLEGLRAKADPNDRILIENMQMNGWSRCIESAEGYKWVQPLYDEDVVLEEVQ